MHEIEQISNTSEVPQDQVVKFWDKSWITETFLAQFHKSFSMVLYKIHMTQSKVTLRDKDRVSAHTFSHGFQLHAKFHQSKSEHFETKLALQKHSLQSSPGTDVEHVLLEMLKSVC